MIELCPVPKTVHHQTLCTLSATMVAERGSTFSTFLKTLTGRTRTLDVETSHTVDNLKSNIQVEQGTLPNHQRLTLSGKQLEDERIISDYNIIHRSTLYVRGRLKGGATMSAEEITSTFRTKSALLQQLQTAQEE